MIVPLLVLWLAYEERTATATSLAAIIFIAAFAAAAQGAYGNVRPLDALLVGGPALLGVLAGTWLQQRLPQRTIALLFAAVLLASALELVLEVIGARSRWACWAASSRACSASAAACCSCRAW